MPEFEWFDFDALSGAEGVPVLVKDIPWVSGWVTYRFLFTAGARQDPPGKEGLAHFFEHLPFQGIPSYPSEELIRNANRELFCGTLNASTGYHRIVFEGQLLHRHRQQAIRVLAELMGEPFLSEKGIAHEKPVIQDEIRSHIRNPVVERISRIANADLYLDHPLGRFSIPAGWEDTVETITREDVLAFRDAYIVKENLVVLAAGDIRSHDVLADVWTVIKALPSGVPIVRPEPLPQWPHPAVCERRYRLSELYKSGPAMQYGARIKAMRLMPRLPKHSLLSVLRNMLQHELLRRLRAEVGQTYSVGLSSDVVPDFASLSLQTSCAEENIDMTRGIIIQVLQEVYDGTTRMHNEFEDMRNAFLDRLAAIDYDVDDLIDTALNDIVSHGRIITIQELRDSASKLSYEDIRHVVSNELTPDKLYWELILP